MRHDAVQEEPILPMILREAAVPGPAGGRARQERRRHGCPKFMAVQGISTNHEDSPQDCAPAPALQSTGQSRARKILCRKSQTAVRYFGENYLIVFYCRVIKK